MPKFFSFSHHYFVCDAAQCLFTFPFALSCHTVPCVSFSFARLTRTANRLLYHEKIIMEWGFWSMFLVSSQQVLCKRLPFLASLMQMALNRKLFPSNIIFIVSLWQLFDNSCLALFFCRSPSSNSNVSLLRPAFWWTTHWLQWKTALPPIKLTQLSVAKRSKTRFHPVTHNHFWTAQRTDAHD